MRIGILKLRKPYIRRMHHQKLVTFLAIIPVTITMLTGCNNHQHPLSSEQVDSNVRQHSTRQTQAGYTLEYKSAITDGTKIFAFFRFIAPEEIDLSSIPDTHSGEKLSFPGLSASLGENSYSPDISCKALSDSDNKNNTLDLVVRITPVALTDTESALDPTRKCMIVFRNIVKLGYDSKYEQELLSTKYAGQTNCLFTPEESERLHPKTLLASGTWTFEIELDEPSPGGMELLECSFSTKALVIRSGSHQYEAVESIEDITITSIYIRPLVVEISFLRPEPFDTFECIYLNAAMFSNDEETIYNDIIFVLNDGTKIALFQANGATESVILEPDRPIILTEVDYLLLPDGTKIKAIHSAS